MDMESFDEADDSQRSQDRSRYMAASPDCAHVQASVESGAPVSLPEYLVQVRSAQSWTKSEASEL